MSVAECAANIYRNANLASFDASYPKRTEQLVADVTVVQTRAADKLQQNGDMVGADRFRRLEMSTRKKVLEDIANLPDDSRQRLRLERVRQITYLIQSLDRTGQAQEIHSFLTSEDYDYFQPQVIDAWLRSLYSCPDWKLSTVGNLTDAQLREGVCSPACIPQARAALSNIEDWRSRRNADWQRSGSIRELHRRLALAIASCEAR